MYFRPLPHGQAALRASFATEGEAYEERRTAVPPSFCRPRRVLPQGRALAEAGWDPAYGARPLKRALQRLVENPLALKLLEGEFAEGDTVRVDARDGELVFEKAHAAEAAV